MLTTRDRLMFEAGWRSALNGFEEAQLVTAAELDELGPGADSLVLLVLDEPISSTTARNAAALAGTGREVLLLTAHAVPDEAALWLDQSPVVVERLDEPHVASGRGMSNNPAEPVIVPSEEGQTVLVGPGTYLLGDPCYFVPGSCWADLLEDWWSRPGQPIGQVRGHSVILFKTALGDGGYEDSDGNGYPVDSGHIGLTPAALYEGEWPPGPGTPISFDRPTLCSNINGTMTFGSLSIDTAI